MSEYAGKRSSTQDLGDKAPQSHAATPGKQTRVEQVDAANVQRRRDAELRSAVQAKAADEPKRVHEAASEGIASPSSPLPHRDRIQALFGPQVDVSGVQAHVGAEASAANHKMGARAFATGDHVVFNGTPDLHTAAHETAHVVQQRGGVQLKDGVGTEGDAYERHADEVADRVVAGDSASDLLAPYAGGGSPGGHGGVQRIVEPGAKAQLPVFVTLGNGSFVRGKILEEKRGEGYLVEVDGRQEVFAYSQLNLHDPRETDAALGDEKWREYVRGKDQHKDATVYDNDGTEFGRKLRPGESYGASMTAAQGRVSRTLGTPMSPDYVQDLHDTGSTHLSHPPEWRNKRSGNSYDGRIGVTLLDEHTDAQGIDSMRKSSTMDYDGRQSGGRMQVTHHIATKPMSSEEVQHELVAITKTYDKTIETAQTSDAILDAIARFTQDLARLHPFEDANTRTNMLLLNKLLAENGFPLAIVDDPKHFYLNKLSAWREKIVAGMKKWQALADKKAEGPDRARPSSSKARGKQPERKPSAQPDDGLDIEVRPIEDLFEDDPQGMAEFEDQFHAAMIEHNAAIIRQRQIAIEALQAEQAELSRLFSTYASLVAKASDGTGAVESGVDHSKARIQDASHHLG